MKTILNIITNNLQVMILSIVTEHRNQPHWFKSNFLFNLKLKLIIKIEIL